MVDGNSYTANFTATDGITATGSVSVAAGSYTDTSGNLGGAGSDTVPIDTQNPTVTVNIVDGSQNDGNTSSNVTFEFSENVTGFVIGDLVAVGGTLSGFTTIDGNSYSVTFNATDGFQGTGSVTVNDLSYTDTAGNLGATGNDTVPVDRLQSDRDGGHRRGRADRCALRLRWSRSSSARRDGLRGRRSVGHQRLVLGAFTVVDADTYTVTFTANNGVEGTGSVTLSGAYTDLAGNAGVTGANDTVAIDRGDPNANGEQISDRQQQPDRRSGMGAVAERYGGCDRRDRGERRWGRGFGFHTAGTGPTGLVTLRQRTPTAVHSTYNVVDAVGNTTPPLSRQRSPRQHRHDRRKRQPLTSFRLHRRRHDWMKSTATTSTPSA